MYLTPQLVDRLIALARRYFPGLQSFSEDAFLRAEVTYKRETIQKARGLLSAEAYGQLLEERQYDEIVARLETIGKDNNLLWLRAPSSGDLRVLYREGLDRPSFCRAMYDLLHGAGTGPERLGRYVAYVQGRGLPNYWTFPTYFLYIMDSDTEMFVKPYAAKWLFDWLGQEALWQWKPNAATYEAYVQMALELKEHLAPFGPTDLVEVQGFLWTAYDEDKKAPDTPQIPEHLASPFSRIFSDGQHALWAFDLMGKVLEALGVESPDDEIFATSVRRFQRGGDALRLIYGQWVVLGYYGPASDPSVALALLEEDAARYAPQRNYVYSQREGEPKINLYWFPLGMVQEHEAELVPLLLKTAVDVAQVHAGWAKSNYRGAYRAAIGEALFSPKRVPALLAQGIAPAPPPIGFFTQQTFDLLTALKDDPTSRFYQEKRSEFEAHLMGPFRDLMAEVARMLPATITGEMETASHLFSRIQKNDFGRGGAHTHYWGAFYPKGARRTSSAQLIAWIDNEQFWFGFMVGLHGDEVRARFTRNLRAHRGAITDILAEGLSGDEYLYGEREAPVASLREWVALADPYPRAAVTLLPDDLLDMTRDELVARIVTAFRAVYPLVLLSLRDDPLPAIAEYLGDGPDVGDEPEDPYPLSECADHTGFSEQVLRHWLRALERKRQAILYGPPGTGKTFLAKQIARHLVGGTDGFWELVQFHPAYAYEDFLQGIRPHRNGDGQLDYPVLPGRFLQFCDKARSRQGACVLIVDEINRANLARVFGELMYLLEYRNEQVPLAVDCRPFSIPENVRILGTMNTADRSIALVDHALRRRFAFIPLQPNYDVLAAWHRRHGTGFDTTGLVEVLKRLNHQINDPNYEVGVSFFMVSDLVEQLESIWAMEIEPYLEEYFFDQRGVVADYRWARIAPEVLRRA